MINEVLVIFKTHLDIGFTDYAANVVDNYINTYIPNAIKVGYELKDTDTPFVWTTGSWLIWESLKRDNGTVEKAIEDGIITWHGLPFTTHTELMNKELFEYGLSLSDRLDERFHKKTIGAKMSDVPGHTIGMVPLLAEHGIKFLHIGVNEATPLPDVPPIFRWSYKGSEVIVMYEHAYGTITQIGNTVIAFGHTHDNKGPQSGDEIVSLYSKLKKEYPNAQIKPATLNDVAERLMKMENLPVVDKEIGDTWIHGAGTDPKKVGMYRNLLRYIENNGVGEVDLSDNLLLVPEHTWGMNTNVYFQYYKDYGFEEFMAYEGNNDRIKVEKSWQEQRSYILDAAEKLGTEISYNVCKPNITDFAKVENEEVDFEISWQLFDTDDYLRYMRVYLQFTPQNLGWAPRDYIKLGLPMYKGGIYTAKIVETYQNGVRWLYKLKFDKNLEEEYGLPYFWVEQCGNEIEVKWLKKGALRLPNAFWFKLKGKEENWEVRKMGEWISPERIIGSPLICATDYGVRNNSVEIEMLDAVLVAPFGRRLFDFENNPTGQDLYVNLYNNIWNTNFPMWYSDDTRFRFLIHKR